MSNLYKAKLHDDSGSASTEIRFKCKDSNLIIYFPDKYLVYNIDEVSFSDKVKNTLREIYLPGNIVCSTRENRVIDKFLLRNDKLNKNKIIFIMENTFLHVILTIIVIIIFFNLEYILPIIENK
jgi:hypothetical protein